MVRSNQIASRDVGALLALTNEVHDLPANPVVRHEAMLRGLGKAVGGFVGVSALLHKESSLKRASLMMLIYHGWANDAQRKTANEYWRSLEPINPVRAPLLRRVPTNPRESAAFLRHDLVSDDAWYSSSYVNERHRPMGLDHGIFSVMAMPGQRTGKVVSLIGIYRAWGERHRFGPREREMLRLFHSQASWLFRCESPVEPPRLSVLLSPRQQQTLQLLLKGDGEKQIAIKLDLSRHTVHEHVKAIYKSIRVSSRGELLAKLLRDN